MSDISTIFESDCLLIESIRLFSPLTIAYDSSSSTVSSTFATSLSLTMLPPDVVSGTFLISSTELNSPEVLAVIFVVPFVICPTGEVMFSVAKVEAICEAVMP